MKQTENYGFEKPDIKEFFKLETWKNNMDKIDETIKKREAEQKITNEEIKKIKNVQFTQADERKNIESKETLPVLFGKIAKWLADLKTVAFSGNYNDLSNKPTIPAVVNNNTTTEAGFALDARQANPNVSGSMAAQMKSNYEPKLQIVSAASTAAELGAGATRTDTIIITIPTGYSFTGFVICDYNNNSGRTLTTIQTVTVSGSNVTVLVLLYNASSGKSNTLARVKALMVKNI